MSNVVSVRLFNIPESLEPGDAIDCTVNDVPHDAVFLRYGEDEDGNEWKRKLWVELPNMRETQRGKLVPDLLESHRDEFIRNADGTARIGYWGG